MRVPEGEQTRTNERARWRVRAGARAMRAIAATSLAACPLLAAACGGGTRQDAGERAASYQMRVVRAEFPAQQTIARPETLELQVRNTGTRTVPNVAVALNSLTYVERFPGLSDRTRPLWAVELGPGPIAKPPVESQEVSQLGGGQTAYVKTWALGPLAAGATQTFRWRLVPLKPGAHTVAYTVFAGLAGKSKAVLVSGAPLHGRFAVAISPAPPLTHVNPETGRIEEGAAPATP